MAAWWPVVQARLLELVPTFTGAADFTVYDGPRTTDTDARKRISVGYSEADETGGSFEVADTAVTSLRQESGTVLCEVVSWSGDDELPTHRAAVLAVFDDLDAAVRLDQQLGVLPQGSTSSLSADLVPARDGKGTKQRLIVTVSYTAPS